MILFVNNETGIIEGTIDGRVHPEGHLKMWIGDPEKNTRFVCEWEPVAVLRKKDGVVTTEPWMEGSMDAAVADVKGPVIDVIYEPQHPQKDLFMQLDKKPSLVNKIKYDFAKKGFVKKTAEEIAAETPAAPVDVVKPNMQALQEAVQDESLTTDQRFEALIDLLASAGLIDKRLKKQKKTVAPKKPLG